MDLKLTLTLADFPEGFDHFVRQLSLNIGKHLEDHLLHMMEQHQHQLPAPKVAPFPEEAARTIAKQAVFNAMEQLAAEKAANQPVPSHKK